MVYGSDKDDFIWKMETVYNPIEKLHLKLAKWHLSKLLKINQESIDKLYDRVYNDIIKEMEYDPKALTKVTSEQLIEKIGEASHVIDKINEASGHYWKKDYNNHMWDDCGLYPIDIDYNAVVNLKGDNDEAE
jgi:hypothetical protein